MRVEVLGCSMNLLTAIRYPPRLTSPILAVILRGFRHTMLRKCLQTYVNNYLAFYFPKLSHVCSGIETAWLKIKIFRIYRVSKKMCAHVSLTKYLLSVCIDSILKMPVSNVY
jgi:hypothetical protein